MNNQEKQSIVIYNKKTKPNSQRWVGGQLTKIPKPSRILQRPETLVGQYLKDVAQNPTNLDAAKEESLARAIEAWDIRTWELVFALPIIVPYLLRFLESCIDGKKPHFTALMRATAKTVKMDGKREVKKGSNAIFIKARRLAAERLRALDRDREYLQMVRNEIKQISGGGKPTLTGWPWRNARSKNLGAYLDNIQQAESTASKARHAFVKANLRLVVMMAGQLRGHGLLYSDLIQEGNLGLIKAVDRFDYRKGVRFSTYASWWIRHYMNRAIQEKSRSIRIPVHMLDASRRVSSVQRTLTNQLGRQPTAEEISELSGFSLDKLEKIRIGQTEQIISLDEPVGEEERRPRLDTFLSTDEIRNPLEEISSRKSAEEIQSLVQELEPKEMDIIRKRFAFDDNREWTLQEIGDLYHVSRERIRQIEERTLKKLRQKLNQREMIDHQAA